jgi:hypothetical protein
VAAQHWPGQAKLAGLGSTGSSHCYIAFVTLRQQSTARFACGMPEACSLKPAGQARLAYIWAGRRVKAPGWAQPMGASAGCSGAGQQGLMLCCMLLRALVSLTTSSFRARFSYCGGQERMLQNVQRPAEQCDSDH